MGEEEQAHYCEQCWQHAHLRAAGSSLVMDSDDDEWARLQKGAACSAQGTQLASSHASTSKTVVLAQTARTFMLLAFSSCPCEQHLCVCSLPLFCRIFRAPVVVCLAVGR